MGMVLSLILMLVYYLVFIGGTGRRPTLKFSPLVGSWLANADSLSLVFFCSSDPIENTKTAP